MGDHALPTALGQQERVAGTLRPASGVVPRATRARGSLPAPYARAGGGPSGIPSRLSNGFAAGRLAAGSRRPEAHLAGGQVSRPGLRTRGTAACDGHFLPQRIRVPFRSAWLSTRPFQPAPRLRAAGGRRTETGRLRSLHRQRQRLLPSGVCFGVASGRDSPFAAWRAAVGIPLASIAGGDQLDAPAARSGLGSMGLRAAGTSGGEKTRARPPVNYQVRTLPHRLPRNPHRTIRR